MMQDIERIVSIPTTKTRCVPEIAGKGDVMGYCAMSGPITVMKVSSASSESRLMRSLRLFHLHDDPRQTEGVLVDAIHDARGYRRIRRELARQYDVGYIDPNIEVSMSIWRAIAANAAPCCGERRPVNETDARRVLQQPRRSLDL